MTGAILGIVAKNRLVLKGLNRRPQMSDRLLSDDGITELHPWLEPVGHTKCDGCIRRTCKAQDTKTAAVVNAEWVKTLEDFHRMPECKFYDNCECKSDIFGIYCTWWQERKRNIGI